MTEATKGVLAMAAAATLWGLSGLYYKAIAHVPPVEVLCHRILWSAVFFSLLLALQGRLRAVRGRIADRRVAWVIAAAALAIGANWFVFISAIQGGRALEASLGYYIFPLVAVGLGYAVLGERFSRLQAAALALTAAGIVVLTVGLGAAPWIALALAGSFGTYGLLKKRIRLEPIVSVFAETLVFLPLVLVILGWIHIRAALDPAGAGAEAWFGRDLRSTLLLIGSGLLTAIPLVLMSYAAQRVRLAAMGLVQFLNPTIQFGVAVAIFGEPFTRWHAVAFPIIWVAIALYMIAGLQRQRAERRAAINSGTLETGRRN